MPNSTVFTPTLTAMPITATLLIVHGMAEHQQRYQRFAQFLADNGIVVMTFDHLGHGQRATESKSLSEVSHSTPVKAQSPQLGYMGNPQPHQRMIADVIAHADILAQDYPQLPHFILGHSMGSFITRCVLQTYSDKLTGAIIMGTSPPNATIIPLIPLCCLLNFLVPHRPNTVLGMILNKINNAPFVKEPNLQDFNWLNSNPVRVMDYIHDPLCGFTFTNNGFYALFSLMQQGVQKNWSVNVRKDLPLLFISGKQDSIGNMGKGIPKIIQSLKSQNFSKVTAHQYNTMRHEILHEDDHNQVYQDILDWLHSSINTATPLNI